MRLIKYNIMTEIMREMGKLKVRGEHREEKVSRSRGVLYFQNGTLLPCELKLGET